MIDEINSFFYLEEDLRFPINTLIAQIDFLDQYIKENFVLAKREEKMKQLYLNLPLILKQIFMHDIQNKNDFIALINFLSFDKNRFNLFSLIVNPTVQTPTYHVSLDLLLKKNVYNEAYVKDYLQFSGAKKDDELCIGVFEFYILQVLIEIRKYREKGKKYITRALTDIQPLITNYDCSFKENALMFLFTKILEFIENGHLYSKLLFLIKSINIVILREYFDFHLQAVDLKKQNGNKIASLSLNLSPIGFSFITVECLRNLNKFLRTLSQTVVDSLDLKEYRKFFFHSISYNISAASSNTAVSVTKVGQLLYNYIQFDTFNDNQEKSFKRINENLPFYTQLGNEIICSFSSSNAENNWEMLYNFLVMLHANNENPKKSIFGYVSKDSLKKFSKEGEKKKFYLVQNNFETVVESLESDKRRIYPFDEEKCKQKVVTVMKKMSNSLERKVDKKTERLLRESMTMLGDIYSIEKERLENLSSKYQQNKNEIHLSNKMGMLSENPWKTGLNEDEIGILYVVMYKVSQIVDKIRYKTTPTFPKTNLRPLCNSYVIVRFNLLLIIFAFLIYVIYILTIPRILEKFDKKYN